jgi:hypothetical protein
MNFDDIEKLELHDQKIRKNLTDSIEIDVSIVQFNDETSSLNVSNTQSHHVVYEVSRTWTTIDVDRWLVEDLRH